MSVVTTTIRSGGQLMDPTFAVLSLDIRKEVNRIPRAELRLVDGDTAMRTFAVSDTAFFEPGKTIEILLRHEGEADETVFEGVVVRHRVESADEGSVLVIGMKDAAVKLTGPRRSAIFRDQSDSDAIGKVVSRASLRTGTLVPTQPIHAELVQYHATDWDFIVSRADAQGLAVVVDGGTVSLSKVAVSGEPNHTLEWGVSEIYNFDIEADAGHQYGDVEGFAWDPRELKLRSHKAEPFRTTLGNLDAGKLARAVGFDVEPLSHPVPIDARELSAWANARMERDRMAMLRGRIAVSGRAAKLLDVLEIRGVGDRFNGKTVVTGLRHYVGDAGWQTDLQFGLAPEWLTETADVTGAAAAGLLPAASGLQIGIVGAFKEDPAGELRVQVQLPVVNEQEQGAVWARLACPDAGPGRGYSFRPEPGDEVVVGFFDGDPRYPVILGALFGSKNTPPKSAGELTEKNERKVIVTKKGTTIGFWDGDKPSVFIETAGKNRIVFDDDTQAVVLSDQHGNKITMNESGIELKSAAGFRVDAEGDVQIKGGKDMSIEGRTVEIKGEKVDIQ